MKCPNCDDVSLEVTHVRPAGETAEARDLWCPVCRYRASSVTFLIERPQQRKHGHGAWALAKKILSGKLARPGE